MSSVFTKYCSFNTSEMNVEALKRNKKRRFL